MAIGTFPFFCSVGKGGNSIQTFQSRKDIGGTETLKRFCRSQQHIRKHALAIDNCRKCGGGGGNLKSALCEANCLPACLPCSALPAYPACLSCSALPACACICGGSLCIVYKDKDNLVKRTLMDMLMQVKTVQLCKYFAGKDCMQGAPVLKEHSASLSSGNSFFPVSRGESER